MASHMAVLVLLLVSMLLFAHASQSQPQPDGPLSQVQGKEWEMHPIPWEVDLGMQRAFNGTTRNRRRLGTFKLCALCTCCGGHRRLCFPSPCCYSINCDIPNKPFGFCSFTPKICNCLSCHL